MEYAIIIFLGVALCVSIYANINMLRKEDRYENGIESLQTQVVELENFIQQFSDNLTTIDTQLKQIDTRGTFEADDEVGFVFKTIQLLISRLQMFNTNKYAEKEKR